MQKPNAPMVGEITRTDLQRKYYVTKTWLDNNYLELFSQHTNRQPECRSFLSDVSITVFFSAPGVMTVSARSPRCSKILGYSISFDPGNIKYRCPVGEQRYPIKNRGQIRYYPHPYISSSIAAAREIGRYVEQARNSLEQDILDIVSGVGYLDYYADS